MRALPPCVKMRLGGPGLRQPEPPGLLHPMASEPADAAVVEVDDPAVANVAGEPAGVVATVVVVVPAVVVAPAALPVPAAAVDRDAAADGVAVTPAVDVADVGHL